MMSQLQSLSQHSLVVADFVLALLGASDGLSVLTTSRVPLTISGEHQFHLDPLDVGSGEEVGPAIQMFASRAADIAVLGGWRVGRGQRTGGSADRRAG